MTHQLLTATLRNWLGDQAGRPPIEGDIDRHVAAHRLGGLLYHIGAGLREPITHLAEKDWANNTAGYLARMQALRSRWPSSAGPPLLIKGADFIENLYGAPGARRCVDIDVLVSPADFEDVRVSFGGDQRRPEPSYERLSSEPAYAEGFIVDGSLIELHRSVGPIHAHQLDEAALFARASHACLDGFQVRYPHPEDRLLLWLHNQSKSGFTDGLWSMVDLALILKVLLQTDGSDSPISLRRLVEPYGLTNAFNLSLLKLSESGLWPTPITLNGVNAAKVFGHLCIHKDTPSQQASALQRQALKLWVCPPGKRRAMALRLLLKGLRSLSPPRAS